MSKSFPASRLGLALLAGLAGVIAGCANDRPTVVRPLDRWEALKELSSGTLRLKCGTSCSGSWRLARSSLKGLYANKVWEDLVASVVYVGYESDLAYFYLARAAEETGSRKAADTYFRLALAATSRCDGWVFNGCDGVDLPKEATAGLARVAAR